MSKQQQQQQQDYLTKQLAELLGFDDGAEDVLEHLLTIESRVDLLDYLTQLLGSDKLDAVRLFVDDVERFQNGEEIIMSMPIAKDDDDDVAAKPAAAAAAATTTTIQPSRPKLEEPKRKVITASMKPSSSATTKTTTTARASKPIAATTKNAGQSNANSKKKNQQQQQQQQQRITSSFSKQQSTSTKQQPQEFVTKSIPPAAAYDVVGVDVVQKSPPISMGKPQRRECGCFGNLHAALANCLTCGRISCQKEGYDFCHFCGYMIHPVSEPDNTNEKKIIEAWNQKERLLQYDRETAQRTVVLDDQEDYFSNTTSVWLTDEERAVAAEKEEARHDDIHRRKGMTLNIAI